MGLGRAIFPSLRGNSSPPPPPPTTTLPPDPPVTTTTLPPVAFETWSGFDGCSGEVPGGTEVILYSAQGTTLDIGTALFANPTLTTPFEGHFYYPDNSYGLQFYSDGVSITIINTDICQIPP